MPALVEGSNRRRAANVVVPIALCVCFAAQCAWFVGTQSLTYDEPVHIIAGLEIWRHWRFDPWNDQPPLARLLVTAPIRFLSRTDWRLRDLGPSGANFWTVSVWPNPARLGWQTRPVNVALGLVLGLGVMAATAPAGDRVRRFRRAACSILLASVVVWGFYGFRIGPVTFRSGSLSGPYARTFVIVPTERPLDVTLRLPAPEYIVGFAGVAQHAVRGQPSFLMGEVSSKGGWLRYFPIVMLLKWPTAPLVLAAGALVLIATHRIRAPRELWLLLIFPTVFLLVAITTNLNVGDRYVLPVYPFLLLLCAATWEVASTKNLAAGLVALVALQAVDVLRYAPDDLSYFNAFVRSDRSYACLSDSNLDWGQGLIALRDYERAHPDEKIWLAYSGGVDPRSYGI